VPLDIAALRAMRADLREQLRLRWAAEAAEAIAHKGDVLQYGGKRGEAADVFNHLAKGLAAAAFQPGGVTFAGLHFECVAEDPPEIRRVVDAVRSL
jgi:hypothetical protein